MAERPRTITTTATPGAVDRGERRARIAPAVDRPSRPFPPDARRRVVVERLRPELDGGRFPVKRTTGETVRCAARVFADGHDVLAAVLRVRHVPPGAAPGAWRELAMFPVGNDEWTAEFIVENLGRYEYSVEGWIDPFASWRHGLEAKVRAGQPVTTELREGAGLLRAAAARARASDDPDAAAIALQLEGYAAVLEGSDATGVDAAAVALDDHVAALMALWPDRTDATPYERTLSVTVDRDAARFSAWYEMFPRSMSTDPRRSGTFREAEARLPDVASMGFDVLYLPPIHPIGIQFRKGRNNAIAAAPGDPGSPWAIGSEAGGHTAIDPALGTFEDFERFVRRARAVKLEIALDLAYQCSPDHPWVREHPEWFLHRPDGTIKYAENPPKRYQDIYPFDFECAAWEALWTALDEVVRFWIAHGVRIFRVDNPHTKSLRFWEWLIADVQRDHPDTIFLAEAFTRPAVMQYLAKAGFSQSYTYFTWRNSGPELQEYLSELTRTELAEYFRPNFFANTPDILHAYLQTGGRAAFQVRLVLAATLSASYGIYSGFELCEHVAVPGGEEYLDSEKYQIRVRDWDAPGNIKPLIRQINAVRRAHPALQYTNAVSFHPTDNPALLCYSKRAPDGPDHIVGIVNLDPHHMQHGWVQVPLAELAGGDADAFPVEDLLTGATYRWGHAWNYVRLDPQADQVAHLLRVVR